MALMEKSHDPVARLEAGDFGTDGNDFACAIGAWNDVIFAAKEIFALGSADRLVPLRCRLIKAGDGSHTLVTSRSL